ncbi:MAG: tRNA 2-thiouridine synthesizing protein D [Paraglaciecola psychrophila]|jgi:tRNA 2-thiouridine synthesizing protein D
MNFSLLVLGAPYSDQSVTTALRFAEAVTASGHSIYRIFFYHDGVNSANALITPPQDETNIPLRWQQLADKNGIDLVVCIASALKRGVLDKIEADRYEQAGDNLTAGFTISGLGQLIDAGAHSDRLVTFGP